MQLFIKYVGERVHVCGEMFFVFFHDFVPRAKSLAVMIFLCIKKNRNCFP